MSANLSNVFLAAFAERIKHVYQAEGSTLKGTVRTETGVVGSTKQFHVYGAGIASLRVANTDVVPMSTTKTPVIATLQDWYASDYSDVFDQLKINFNDLAAIEKAIGMALRRRHDQIIIDAINATASPQTVAQTVGANDAFNMGKIRRAKRLLDDAGVPSGGRHLAVTGTGIEQLLGSPAITSQDYSNVKRLIDGEIDSLLGFKIHNIETRANEGGLPNPSGTLWRALAWHEEAVGLAEGMAFKAEVNYVPQRLSWLATGMLSAGAITIEDNGIVRITFDANIEVDTNEA